MMNKEIVRDLKNDAVAKGICAPWRAKFRDNLSIPALIRMYLRGIDFCISEDYPTLDFLRSKLKGVCEPYGLFVDDVVQCYNVPDIVLNGACKAELKYGEFSVSRLYVRHESTTDVIVSGNALVTIDAFDNSILNIHATDKCRVVLAQYGNSKVNIIQGDENVSINVTSKKTY